MRVNYGNLKTSTSGSWDEYNTNVDATSTGWSLCEARGYHAMELVSTLGSNQHKRIEHGACIECGKKGRRVFDWDRRTATWWRDVVEA